jgi:DNA (cytosine-5)-methyltransferase 1
VRFGSVCSGIEAASVAWHPLGWKAAWLSEIEPFPSAVLAHHYPDVPNLGDMTLLPERILSGEVEAPDVFCGGTPCQAFSVAGLRNSLDDARGNLSLTFVGIANAIDHVRSVRRDAPGIIFWENVPGVLSTKDNAFGCFLGALAGEDDPILPPGEKWTNAGCVYGPQRTVAWRVLDAQYFGVAQRRRRVFVVASAREDFDPAAVLFEFDGVRRDTAPSRQAGKESSSGAGNGAASRSWPAEVSSTLDTTFGTKQGLEDQHVNAGCPLFVPASTVQTLRCRRPGEGGMSGDDEHLIPVISPALNTCSGSHHAPDTKAYVVQPLDSQTFSCAGIGAYKNDNASATLLKSGQDLGNGCEALVAQPMAYTTKMHNTTSNQAGKFYEEYLTSLDANSPPPAVFQPIALQDVTPREKAQNGRGWNDDGTAYTVDTHATQGVAQAIPIDTMNMTPGHSSGGLGFGQPGDPSFTLTKGHSHAVAQPISFGAQMSVAQVDFDLNQTLQAKNPMAVMQSMAVRRLTPVECERLQGFPDGYTNIPWRKKDESPDGPRYKALGNSWAVPVVRWIGHRIQQEINK